MPTDREILAERVRQRIDQLGRNPRDVSIAATGKPDLVRDIYRQKRMPTGPVMHRLADVLETTTDHLLGLADSADQPVSEVSIREMKPGWNGQDRGGIPLVGTAFCDDLAVEDAAGGALQVERVLLDIDHTVRMIARPPALWAARDAYAIYFHGSSMEPRFKQGEMGIVDPRRPPSPGDDVVVQLNDGNGGRDVMTVLVKELVGVTSGFVELRQYNPAHDFRVPRRQVARLHRIVPSAELFNV